MGSISLISANGQSANATRLNPAIYGVAFFCAALAFCLKSLLDTHLGVAATFFAIAGNATCGWSWLATRSLFRPEPDQQRIWPILAVLFLMTAGAIGSFAVIDGLPLRILGNLSGLGSSAMLLLALTEPLLTMAEQSDRAERTFRTIYAGGYAIILALAVLAVNGAPKDSAIFQLSVPIKAVCAIAAVCGYGLAAIYRKHHPLQFAPPRRPRKTVNPDLELRDQLTNLMTGAKLYEQPNLRVSDLAKLTGEQEYKVTQCITGALGFANFNQMVNRYRINEAKQRLVDPALAHLPILTIALDCGFGSIGPFNRAFKADTGTTPLEYRRRLSA